MAIIGCGAVAQHHARHLGSCASTRLVGVVDSNCAAAQAFADKWKLPRSYAAMAELLAGAEVDALHITTPPQSHEPLVREALEHGLDVMVEKPVAFSHSATSGLYRLAAARGRQLIPDFSLYFTDLMCRAREWVAAGALGRVVSVECAYQTRLDRARLEEALSPPWQFQLPMGPLHNFITHPLYLVLQFTGPVRALHVAPRHAGYLPQGLTDHLDLLIDGEQCSGLVNVSLAAQPTQIRLVIHGERARVIVDFESFQIELEKAPARFGSLMRLLRPSLRGLAAMRQTGRTGVDILRKRLVPYAGLKALIERFYAPALGSREIPIPPSLVLAVAQVEEQVLQSPGKWALSYPHACPVVPAASRSKWVAVTGGTGRLGTQVVRELRRGGYAVRLLVRWQSRGVVPFGDDVEVVYGDARDLEAVRQLLRGTEAVVHMAAGMSGSREFVLESCVEATRNVLQAARELGLQRNIYLSSMAVFDYRGLGRNDSLRDDRRLEAAPDERSAYAEAKTRAERLVAEEMSRRDPTWMILRPSQIFGTGNLTSQLGSSVGRTLLLLGGPSKRMRLVQVEDVAAVIVSFLEPDRFRPGAVLNISHPDIVLASEVATLLRKHCGFRVIYLRPWLGKALALGTRLSHAVLGRGPRISSGQAAYLFCETGADASGVSNLGWRPASPLAQQVENALQHPSSHSRA